MKWQDTAEYRRLADAMDGKAEWREWGAYLAERAWGTVREDYSPDAEPWHYFTYDQARSRAYRWNEDGLGGVCNRFQNLCLAVAFWNEQDDHLKERLFGLSGPEGNHGEDVKELYYYLDATPTHSYLKMLYKYPQVAFPYGPLREESARRGYDDPEYEITDALSDVWEQGRYFDITIEWAKADAEDLLCRITAINRGPDPAPLHILPHLWGRNTWSWGYNPDRPELHAVSDADAAIAIVHAHERHLGDRAWYVTVHEGEAPVLLFTENDTNTERCFGVPNRGPYVKDGFHDRIVRGVDDAVNPERRGTKAAAHIRATVPAEGKLEVWVRFAEPGREAPFEDFSAAFDARITEADEFYAAVQSPELTEDQRRIQRQAWAGLIWTQQLYHYSVELWLDGDPDQPKPPPETQRGRNQKWRHLYNIEVLSMPDKWEYPWYAAWDLAFHMLPMAMIDPDFAKSQLLLMLREWYQHPNGQIPAYEWHFDDANPPVHAWAVWRVYHIDHALRGEPDPDFLERAFHKLLLNFTWWVNRKDHDDNNVFQGGFLGLDNIGVFDRSKPLPTGGHIDQADGTAWMAMYCLNMLHIALELARTRPVYEDVATKFFEHFIYISYALAHMGRSGIGIWDEEDGFYYDVLHMPDDSIVPLKVRSFVGLVPLFAVEILEPDLLDRLPNFRRRMEWFLEYRPHLVQNIAPLQEPGEEGRFLLALADREKLARVLQRMFDPDEFLSPYGLRSLSRYHAEHPYTFHVNGESHTVGYEPAESRSGLFGGNSNWRGPVWFPTNYLMIESLRKYALYYGDSLTVETPLGSGDSLPLGEAAEALAQRLRTLFEKDDEGHRPIHGECPLYRQHLVDQDLILFHEYFHGETGAGLGASHQTGWTALITKLIQEIAGGETCVSSAADGLCGL